MLNYAVQLAGHDFEPVSPWTTDPQRVVTQLQADPGYDLLVWDPQADNCEIYPQQTAAALADRLEHTAYARLLGKMSQVFRQAGHQVTPQLQAQWYLVAELACLAHQSLLNTAAAMLSLTVQALKAEPRAQADATWSQQLHGLADQARCWLLAADVSMLQLVATDQPLTTLLAYLLAQTDGPG